jgi:hypothetical protein
MARAASLWLRSLRSILERGRGFWRSPRLRRFRLRPSKVPWRVLIGEPHRKLEPRESGAGGAGPDWGSSMKADVWGAKIRPLEARVENALWTSLQHDLDGIDVGVGQRIVCIATATGVRTVKTWDGTEGPKWYLAGGVRRVSTSYESEGSDEPEVPWVVRQSDLSIGALYKGAWRSTGDEAGLDVAAGRVQLTGLQQLKAVHCATKQLGELKTLWMDDAADWSASDVDGAMWMPPTHTYYYMGIAITTVALERLPGSISQEGETWFIRADGQLGNAAHPSWQLAELPDGAWDIGAGDGVVWAVGTTQSPDPGSKGNSLWHYDPDRDRWNRVVPGWGVAVDVDAHANPWVLDSEGKLHVRGGRIPAVAGGVRGAPKDTKDSIAWTEYLNDYGDTLADLFGLPSSGPGLQPESNLEAWELGAGGSIELWAWDVYEANKVAAKHRIGQLTAKRPGLEMLFCLAPIFTTRPSVPASVLPFGSFDFANVKLIDAYVAAIAELAAIPGFAKRVRYFSLGNEVDFLLANLPQPVWESFITFIKEVVKKVKEKNLLPHAKLGVNWTLQGIRVYPEAWKLMVEACDALFINYYAVDYGADRPVVAPSTYHKDFADLLALPGKYGLEKPIVLQEVGMPTDKLLGGSETLQLDFVKFVLEQWDKAGLLIPFLSWFQLYDFLYDENLKVALGKHSSIVVTQTTDSYPTRFTYYGKDLGPFWGAGNELAFVFRSETTAPTNENHVNALNDSTGTGRTGRLCRFLSTCGLVDQKGERKLAWDTYQQELAKRRRQT